MHINIEFLTSCLVNLQDAQRDYNELVRKGLPDEPKNPFPDKVIHDAIMHNDYNADLQTWREKVAEIKEEYESITTSIKNNTNLIMGHIAKGYWVRVGSQYVGHSGSDWPGTLPFIQVYRSTMEEGDNPPPIVKWLDLRLNGEPVNWEL